MGFKAGIRIVNDLPKTFPAVGRINFSTLELRDNISAFLQAIVDKVGSGLASGSAQVGVFVPDTQGEQTPQALKKGWWDNDYSLASNLLISNVSFFLQLLISSNRFTSHQHKDQLCSFLFPKSCRTSSFLLYRLMRSLS